jgi:hypothetical protein
MTLGDWSGPYSPSPTTEHITLPDHIRGLVDHSSTMLGDSSTKAYAVLGTISTTPRPQLEVCFPWLHVKFDSHTFQRSALF